MKLTRLALIAGGGLVVGSGILNAWVTHAKMEYHIRIPYPPALDFTAAIGWILLVPAAFIARKKTHKDNLLARILVLSAALATFTGGIRVG